MPYMSVILVWMQLTKEEKVALIQKRADDVLAGSTSKATSKSAGGNYLISGSRDMSIILWDVGKKVKRDYKNLTV